MESGRPEISWIRTIPALGDNFIFLISWDGGAAVVDPGEAEPVVRVLTELNLPLTHILLTHHHGDHTGGCRSLKKRYGAVVAGSGGIGDLGKRLSEGDTVQLGPHQVTVLDVPGHTRTHLAYHLTSHRAVFTGDTLFAAGCGRLSEGTAEQMWRSLQRLGSLPDDTLVYCGHEYTEENLMFALSVEPENRAAEARLRQVRDLLAAGRPSVPSTVGEEKRYNPFLRSGSQEIRAALGMAGAPDVDVFAELRRRKDRF